MHGGSGNDGGNDGEGGFHPNNQFYYCANSQKLRQKLDKYKVLPVYNPSPPTSNLYKQQASQ